MPKVKSTIELMNKYLREFPDETFAVIRKPRIVAATIKWFRHSKVSNNAAYQNCQTLGKRKKINYLFKGLIRYRLNFQHFHGNLLVPRDVLYYKVYM